MRLQYLPFRHLGGLAFSRDPMFIGVIICSDCCTACTADSTQLVIPHAACKRATHGIMMFVVSPYTTVAYNMAMLWALIAMGTAMEHSSHIICTMHCVICDAHCARRPHAIGRLFVLVVCNAKKEKKENLRC